MKRRQTEATTPNGFRTSKHGRVCHSGIQRHFRPVPGPLTLMAKPGKMKFRGVQGHGPGAIAVAREITYGVRTAAPPDKRVK